MEAWRVASVTRMDVAGGHGVIRVSGPRENNLGDVRVEIPKRRLTCSRGVSGSGESSLVVNTIAAESQRLINETYSVSCRGSCRLWRDRMWMCWTG